MTILTGLLDGCVLQCIELLAKEYDEMLCKALDKLAPKKTRTIVIQPNAPWYNEEITTQKRKRWRLKHKWHSTGLEIDRVNYLEQCNVVKWNHAHPLRVSSLSILVMRAWLPLSQLGVLASSLTSTCIFMHTCLASVDHHFIISAWTYLELGSISLAVHAFVTSKLDYCNALLYGMPKYQLQRLGLSWCTGTRGNSYYFISIHAVR